MLFVFGRGLGFRCSFLSQFWVSTLILYLLVPIATHILSSFLYISLPGVPGKDFFAKPRLRFDLDLFCTFHRNHLNHLFMFCLILVVIGKRELDARESCCISKDVSSIESSPVSWHRVVILQEATGLVVKAFTARNLRTKTVSDNIFLRIWIYF